MYVYTHALCWLTAYGCYVFLTRHAARVCCLPAPFFTRTNHDIMLVVHISNIQPEEEEEDEHNKNCRQHLARFHVRHAMPQKKKRPSREQHLSDWDNTSRRRRRHSSSSSTRHIIHPAEIGYEICYIYAHTHTETYAHNDAMKMWSLFFYLLNLGWCLCVCLPLCVCLFWWCCGDLGIFFDVPLIARFAMTTPTTTRWHWW